MTDEEKREMLTELLNALLLACDGEIENQAEIFIEDSVNSIMEVFKCE